MTFEEWWKDQGQYFESANYLDAKRMAKAAWEAARPKWLPLSSAPMGKRVLVKRFGHEPEIRRIVKEAKGDIVAIRDCGRRVLISVFDAYMELPKGQGNES